MQFVCWHPQQVQLVNCINVSPQSSASVLINRDFLDSCLRTPFLRNFCYLLLVWFVSAETLWESTLRKVGDSKPNSRSSAASGVVWYPASYIKWLFFKCSPLCTASPHLGGGGNWTCQSSTSLCAELISGWRFKDLE